MKQFILIITLLAMVPVLAFGVSTNPKTLAPIYPVATGDEVVNAPVGPVAPLNPVMDETDLVGQTYDIGTTWYDNQHNGTCGRMNTKETNGWLQFVWMKGEDNGATVRHIWWNGIDPNGIQVYPGTGVAVESSIKGGFVNMDVGSNGAAFPGYHEVWSGSNNLPWASASMDLIPHSGAFLDYPTPNNPAVTQTIWPRIQIGQNQRIHMVCTNQVPTAANPQRQWYMSGTYDPNNLTLTWNPTWTQMDWTQTIAADVAVSPVALNNKTLFAWTRSMSFPTIGEPDPNSTYPQLNNDVYYLIDADGLNPNFAQKINLTNFIPPDLTLLPDTLHANKDTLRCYTCLNTFIDHNNYAHIAFTTRSYFAIEGTSYWNSSIIWHWSEQYPDSFKMITPASLSFPNPSDSRWWAYCGAWNVRAQRPSLGEDAAGVLYCMYQVYDTDSSHLSNTVLPNGNGMGAPSGEIYVTKSLDGGLSWAEGTNVTGSITPYHATAGNCRSELTPTMAKKVDTYAHIEYVYDLDAGNVIQTEGAWTNNPVRYHRVPVNQIASTPLVLQNRSLHITAPPPPPPSLDITMAPVGGPITIPAGGGSFSFNVSLNRLLGPQAPYSVWIRAKQPNGTMTAPLLGPVTVNTPVGSTVTRNRNQNIANTWPAGLTYYIGYVNNTFSYPPIDSSFFTFTKLATGADGPLVWDNVCSGELFPGEVGTSAPTTFAVEGAYPNPFNPTTTISYTLPEASHVSLTVFDTNGRTVATLVNGLRDAGRHQVTFDGSDLASGVYFYNLTSGANVITGKMALVK